MKDLKELPARLTTLAHDRNLSLPLTIPVESATGPASLKIPDDVQTTVLLCLDKKIVARSFFKSGELTSERIEQLTEAAKLLARTVEPSATKPGEKQE